MEDFDHLPKMAGWHETKLTVPEGQHLSIGNIKPNYNITFHNNLDTGGTGRQVCRMDFNGQEMIFEGDDEESAKVFIDWIAHAFKGRLEEEREAGAAEERKAKNAAYNERNQLVALLSTLFPSGKAKTAIEGWDEAWHGCVYIDFPWGQASWHYHTDDEWMFSHLPPYTKQWNGHTTEEKYSAIHQAIKARTNK